MFCWASISSLPFLQVISSLPSIVENETPVVPDIGGFQIAHTLGPAPSLSGTVYQPNFLPSIGLISCAQWVWSLSPPSSQGSRTLIRSRLSGSLFWQTTA